MLVSNVYNKTKQTEKTISMNNNTANNINATYKIEIADRTGHTTLADLDIDQAVNEIVKNAENNARWVFINGEKYEFSAGSMSSAANIEALKTRLQSLQDPSVLLTGVLVGGHDFRGDSRPHNSVVVQTPKELSFLELCSWYLI